MLKLQLQCPHTKKKGVLKKLYFLQSIGIGYTHANYIHKNFEK